jgi:hypothetical protein
MYSIRMYIDLLVNEISFLIQHTIYPQDGDTCINCDERPETHELGMNLKSTINSLPPARRES